MGDADLGIPAIGQIIRPIPQQRTELTGKAHATGRVLEVTVDHGNVPAAFRQGRLQQLPDLRIPALLLQLLAEFAQANFKHLLALVGLLQLLANLVQLMLALLPAQGLRLHLCLDLMQMRSRARHLPCMLLKDGAQWRIRVEQRRVLRFAGQYALHLCDQRPFLFVGLEKHRPPLCHQVETRI
ncbi:hypothetical protein D3C76_1300610 [compost metagenome]